jgi:glycosyltransferase involved in cell wall biosynthesis
VTDPDVDVVLPVLDEAQALPWVLARIPPGYRPIVVDNGSTDGSAGIAGRLGALVIDEPRRGFGAACHAGLRAARAPLVCFMDADASCDPAELPGLARPVIAETADLVIGSRVAVQGAWPWHARLANRFLAKQVGRWAGHRFDDLGPMRAARREDLLFLGILDRGFGWPLEMVLRALRAGWRIEQAATTYLPRAGRSKVTGTVR